MRRHHRIGDAIDQSVTLQPLQRLRQHPLAHPAHLAAQFAEAMRAAFQRDQDQHAPLAGQVPQHLARRAIGRHQVAAPHADREGFDRIFHTYVYVCTYD
ncbi:MAG: hypothetical protein BGP17_17650 [Sphingomonas sp. 67-41]|nr:MAG: hypothetical protein BGP17_17650 [Sphingomonas sp. 67-41]